MNKWELARYIIDGKKSVDTVLFLAENGSKVSNINIRQEVNDAKQKFYVSICVVMDKCFPRKKKVKSKVVHSSVPAISEIIIPSIMDDVVFEMELVKQVEVNIDYILMLVGKYHDGNCEDKEILVAIDKAIKSSLQLRSKKELIENFIATINTSTNVNTDWQRFVREQRETDIQTLITEEKLKPEETRKFVENAFRDGVLKTTGTDVDRLMPPVSRFGGGGSRDKKKQTVIEKLKGFFEKYFGLVSPEVSKESDKVTYLYDTEPTLSMVAEEPVHYGMKKDN